MPSTNTLAIPRLTSFARNDNRSPERWGIHQAAVSPQRIQAARHSERRFRAEAAVEDLAVVPDFLDDARGPARVETEAVGDARLEPEESLHGRVCARLERRDIRLRDP